MAYYNTEGAPFLLVKKWVVAFARIVTALQHAKKCEGIYFPQGRKLELEVLFFIFNFHIWQVRQKTGTYFWYFFCWTYFLIGGCACGWPS
jgi:hypothetical protein